MIDTTLNIMYDLLKGVITIGTSLNLTMPSYINFEIVSNLLDIDVDNEESLLNILRDRYISNYTEFDLFVTKLKLLGIKFSNSKIRSFANIDINTTRIIVANENKSDYLKFTDKLEQFYFRLKYGVNNEMFFNYMSVELLAYFFEESEETVTKALIESDFDVFNLDTKKATDFIKLYTPKRAIENYNDALISEVFKDNQFSRFVKICHSKNLKTVDEIDDEILTLYSELSSVGVKKVLAVKNKLTDNNKTKASKNNNFWIYKLLDFFTIGDFRQKYSAFDPQYNELVDIVLNDSLSKKEVKEHLLEFYDKYQTLPILNRMTSILTLLKDLSYSDIVLNQSIYEVFANAKLTLSIPNNLQQANIDQIDLYLGELTADQQIFLYRYCLEYYEKFSTLNNFYPEYSKREIFVLEGRLDGQTLEEIAKNFDVTRERIRQIEKKAKTKFDNYAQKLVDILSSSSYPILINQSFLSNLSSFSSTHNFLLCEFLVSTGRFKKLGDIYIDSNLLAKVDNYIIERQIFNLDSFYEYLSDYLAGKDSDVVSNTIIKVLETYNYNNHRNIFYKSLHYFDKFKYILENAVVLNGSFTISEEGFYEITELLAHYFGDFNYKSYEVDGRALYSVLDRSVDVGIIRTSKDRFSLIAHQQFQQFITNDVSRILVEDLSKEDFLTVENFFLTREKYFKEKGIDNYYYLYALIKKYDDNLFEIGHHNTMTISLRNTKGRIKIIDRITNLLSSKKRSMSKKEIIRTLKLNEISYTQAIAGSNEVFQLLGEDNNNYCVLVKDFKVSEYLRTYVVAKSNDQIKKNKYLNVNEFYNNIIRTDLFDEISNLTLAHPNGISSLIKFIVPELRGQSNILYLEGQDISIDDITMEKFPRGFHYDEYSKLLIETFNYSEQSVSSYLYSLVINGIYFDAGDRNYVKSEILNLSRIDLKLLNNCIDSVFNGLDYLSLKDLRVDYFEEIIEFDELTHVLLMEILQSLNYSVFKTYSNYKNPFYVMLNPNGSFTNLNDLIDHLINRYSGEMSLSKLTEYFKNLNLLNRKGLEDYFEESTTFYVDEYGWIRRNGR